MSYHSALGALSCPQQCNGNCANKFGDVGFQFNECVKACLPICAAGGGGGGGSGSPDEAKGAFLGAAGLFAVAAVAIGAFVYFGKKR